MRLTFIAAAIFLLSLHVRATTPAPLREAFNLGTDGSDHWAYTETTKFGFGKVGTVRTVNETIVRFDPSKPYAEQYTPLKIDGKPPTEKQKAEYRKRGEQRAKEMARTAADNPSASAPSAEADDDNLDLDHAVLSSETATSFIYEVPLRADGDIPARKVQLLVRVGKERHVIENYTLRVLEPFRVKLVAKISRGQGSIDYVTVDPKFPPVLAASNFDFGLSFFFMKRDGAVQITRTDFQRVKPFNERFTVKIGPLKAFGF